MDKVKDRRIEITKKGHLFNGIECKGGEQFDVSQDLLKQMVADGLGKDVTPSQPAAPAKVEAKTK